MDAAIVIDDSDDDSVRVGYSTPHSHQTTAQSSLSSSPQPISCTSTSYQDAVQTALAMAATLRGARSVADLNPKPSEPRAGSSDTVNSNPVVNRSQSAIVTAVTTTIVTAMSTTTAAPTNTAASQQLRKSKSKAVAALVGSDALHKELMRTKSSLTATKRHERSHQHSTATRLDAFDAQRSHRSRNYDRSGKIDSAVHISHSMDRSSEHVTASAPHRRPGLAMQRSSNASSRPHERVGASRASCASSASGTLSARKRHRMDGGYARSTTDGSSNAAAAVRHKSAQTAALSIDDVRDAKRRRANREQLPRMPSQVQVLQQQPDVIVISSSSSLSAASEDDSSNNSDNRDIARGSSFSGSFSCVPDSSDSSRDCIARIASRDNRTARQVSRKQQQQQQRLAKSHRSRQDDRFRSRHNSANRHNTSRERKERARSDVRNDANRNQRTSSAQTHKLHHRASSSQALPQSLPPSRSLSLTPSSEHQSEQQHQQHKQQSHSSVHAQQQQQYTRRQLRSPLASARLTTAATKRVPTKTVVLDLLPRRRSTRSDACSPTSSRLSGLSSSSEEEESGSWLSHNVRYSRQQQQQQQVDSSENAQHSSSDDGASKSKYFCRKSAPGPAVSALARRLEQAHARSGRTPSLPSPRLSQSTLRSPLSQPQQSAPSRSPSLSLPPPSLLSASSSESERPRTKRQRRQPAALFHVDSVALDEVQAQERELARFEKEKRQLSMLGAFAAAAAPMRRDSTTSGASGLRIAYTSDARHDRAGNGDDRIDDATGSDVHGVETIGSAASKPPVARKFACQPLDAASYKRCETKPRATSLVQQPQQLHQQQDPQSQREQHVSDRSHCRADRSQRTKRTERPSRVLAQLNNTRFVLHPTAYSGVCVRMSPLSLLRVDNAATGQCAPVFHSDCGVPLTTYGASCISMLIVLAHILHAS